MSKLEEKERRIGKREEKEKERRNKKGKEDGGRGGEGEKVGRRGGERGVGHRGTVLGQTPSPLRRGGGSKRRGYNETTFKIHSGRHFKCVRVFRKSLGGLYSRWNV